MRLPRIQKHTNLNPLPTHNSTHTANKLSKHSIGVRSGSLYEALGIEALASIQPLVEMNIRPCRSRNNTQRNKIVYWSLRNLTSSGCDLI